MDHFRRPGSSDATYAIAQDVFGKKLTGLSAELKPRNSTHSGSGTVKTFTKPAGHSYESLFLKDTFYTDIYII